MCVTTAVSALTLNFPSGSLFLPQHLDKLKEKDGRVALISLREGKVERPICDDGKDRQWRNRHGEVSEGSWVDCYILFYNPFATAVLTVFVFDVDPSPK